MVLGDAVTKLQTFVWSLTMFQESWTWSLFNFIFYSTKLGQITGAPNENIVQNHLNIALLNVLKKSI